jgi:hypothetical protein
MKAGNWQWLVEQGSDMYVEETSITRCCFPETGVSVWSRFPSVLIGFIAVNSRDPAKLIRAVSGRGVHFDPLDPISKQFGELYPCYEVESWPCNTSPVPFEPKPWTAVPNLSRAELLGALGLIVLEHTPLDKLIVVQLVKKFPCPFWYPKVHYRVHKLPRLDLIPAHTLKPYFFVIHFNIVLPSTPKSPKWCLPFSFSHWNVSIFHLTCVLHVAPITSSLMWPPS